MAKKNDLTKRAEELLTNRRAPVQRLGELLDTKADQEALLDETNTNIEKAAVECIEAGWSRAELADIGVPSAALPKSSRPRRKSQEAVLEPRGSQSAPDRPAAPSNTDSVEPPEPADPDVLPEYTT